MLARLKKEFKVVIQTNDMKRTEADLFAVIAMLEEYGNRTLPYFRFNFYPIENSEADVYIPNKKEK